MREQERMIERRKIINYWNRINYWKVASTVKLVAGVTPGYVAIRERRYANKHMHTDVCFSIMVETFY